MIEILVKLVFSFVLLLNTTNDKRYIYRNVCILHNVNPVLKPLKRCSEKG